MSIHLRDDIRQLKTGARELRKFGLLVGGVFAALGLFVLLRHRPAGPYLLAAGAFLSILGLAAPRVLKPIYFAWMVPAMLLGFAVSAILLTLLFFGVITPIGWVARCFGNDFLSLKRKPEAPSYWLPRERKPKSRADYERQF